MQFKYKAKKLSGEVVEGTLDAESRKLVINQLQKMQVFPISIEEVGGGKGLQKEINWKSIRGVSRADVTTFSRQLSDLLRSGLPLVRCLQVIRQQTFNASMVDIIRTLENDVSGGMHFSDSMQKHPKVFGNLYSSMVRAGEAGGMLDEVMERLAQFLENEQETRSKIISSMTYPAFMVLVCIAVIAILFIFVVPNFQSMFEEMEVELPISTQILMGFTAIVQTWWPIVLVGAGVGIFMLVQYLRTEQGKRQFDYVKLQIPLFGDLIRKREIAKFGRTLGTLLANGVAILKALDITQQVISNQVLKEDIKGFSESIKEGERLSTRMAQSDLFPPIAINMVAVGEETGSLETTLERVADAFENETERVIKAITTIIEPVMIVFMAVVVGFVVFAMIMPIFSLSQSM